MAYSEGQLNGAADYRVGIEINYSGVQDYGANTSRFDWAVYLQNPTSYGSWSGSTQYWSANIGGNVYSGTFGIPQSERYTKTRAIASGSTWIGHDGSGYRPGFVSSAYLDTDHSNIGDGGSGDAWVDAPRIPIPPGAPTSLGFDQITPTSMRFRFSGTTDGGAAIDGWEIQYATDAGFTQNVMVVSSSGTSTLTGLRPGTVYYARARGHNNRGWSGYSGTSTAKTLSGAYVWNGTEWRPTEVLVWNGASWVQAEVQIRKASTWEAAG